MSGFNYLNNDTTTNDMDPIIGLWSYDEIKEEETCGFNQNFVEEIYDMPENVFKNNILEGSLPELDKLPIPANINSRFPFRTVDPNINRFGPPQLVRELTVIVQKTFEDWLYHYRYMLQYFTVEEMFNIYNFNISPIYNIDDEPNAWIDEALEEMYYISSEDETENNAENAEEFEFNLEWDIEKGNYQQSKSQKLSLYLPEEVGMRPDHDEEGNL